MRWALTIMLPALLFAPVAQGQGTEAAAPSASDRQEAKRLFDEGRAAFRRGAYDVAIDKWHASLALSGEPLIHYNIGNAHERAGDLELAIDHFEQWLQHAPDAERPDLEARIAKLRERIADAPPPATPPPSPSPIAAPVPDDEVLPPSPAPPRTPTVWPTAGWITFSVGGAATLTGMALAITAGVTRPDVDEACVEAEQLLCRADEADAIRQSNLFANVGDGLWIGGAAVAAAGLSLLIFAPSEEPIQSGWHLSIDGFGASARRSF